MFTKRINLNPLTLLPMLLLVFTISSCDVEQTEEGDMPEVDVDVEEGNMPEYDVDWADVDISTRQETIQVPKVRVTMEEEVTEVPYIDVTMPDEMGEKGERTLLVEAEISGEEQEIDIQEVYAVGDRLIVLATLEPTGQSLGDETIRVSDQIVLNAPDMTVKHYIIGEKPESSFNNQYTYISSRSEISDILQNGRQIYSD